MSKIIEIFGDSKISPRARSLIGKSLVPERIKLVEALNYRLQVHESRWGSDLLNTITFIVTANGNCNVEYLKESIESILNQTCKDYELIIVNHGCELVQSQIIWEYFESNNKIKLLTLDQNIYDPKIPNLFGDRVFNAISAALFCSEGDYVFFFSYDDFLSSNYVELMLPIFLNNPNCVAASPAVLSVNHVSELNVDRSKIIFENNLRPTYIKGIELAKSVINGGNLFMVPGGTFCCKTDIVLANEGFDCMFDLSQLFKFAILGDVGTNKEAVLYWRHHDNQTNKQNKKSGILLYAVTLEWIGHIKNFYYKHNISINYQNNFFEYIYKDLKSHTLLNIQDAIRTGIQGTLGVLSSIFSEAPKIYIFYFLWSLLKNLHFLIYASLPVRVKNVYRAIKASPLIGKLLKNAPK